MSFTILLYGATGFSGRLIAAQSRAPDGLSPDCRLILAGRDGAALRTLADETGLAFRVFGLDDPARIARYLDDIHVILNAAGPFAFTAPSLAEAALIKGCHYVDINGEVDVYRTLDDTARRAFHRGISMVCGAGASGAGSDLLLDHALDKLLSGKTISANDELGAIRIAMSQAEDFSRGSATTAIRSLREQVLVVRKGQVPDASGTQKQQMVFWHEPVGRLERSFDFGKTSRKDGQNGKSRIRIASAANLIDTLIARHTVKRRNLLARSIESYVETGNIGRIAYQLGGMLSPMLALPWVARSVQAQTALLPKGPRHDAMATSPHVIVVQIDDIFGRSLIDWRFEIPNIYAATAQLALAVACQLADGNPKHGWITPSGVLQLPWSAGDKPQLSGWGTAQSR